MWCVNCQSDVVAELGSDNRRVRCSICGTALGETAASQMERQQPPLASQSRTSDAQQLLDRWANSHIFDPYAPPKNGIGETRPTVTSQSIAAAASPSIQAGFNPPAIDEPRTASAELRDQGVDLAPPRSATNSLEHAGQSHTPTPARSALSATSDELDRLTNEILSRVARITENAQHAPPAVPRQPEPTALTTRVADSASDLADAESESGKTRTAEHSENETPRRQSARRDPRPILDDVGSKQWRIDAREGQPTPAQSPVPKPHTPSQKMVAAEAELTVEHRELKGAVAKLQAEQQQDSGKKAGNWFGGLGQALAYMGILGLTAGTSLVILGYFGGPAQYAPTGWLITTVGQMLLFLGVVTLVSAGMEQTTVEVKQTMDESLKELTAKLTDLGDRIIRIEHIGHEAGPPEPHIFGRVRTRESERV